MTTAFELCFGICRQKDIREAGRTEIEWNPTDFGPF
jgi:hypothetical protein